MSAPQITLFIAAQASALRKPTFSVWIAGISDVTEYVYTIDTERAIESLKGYGNVNIGRAELTASNEDNTFIVDGIRQIEDKAKIKIWSGFDGRNIPVFTGIITAVKPDVSEDNVSLVCKDYMGLFLEVIERGHQGSTNNTIKLILEAFATEYLLNTDISSFDEYTEVLDNPSFDLQSKLSVIEKLMSSIFSVVFFDEDGTMLIQEREHYILEDWTYDDVNINDCELLSNTEIINSIEIEYEENFLLREEDALSVDSYGLHRRAMRLEIINSVLVSSYYYGATSKRIGLGTSALEGFEITSAATASMIGCVAVKLRQDGASGYMTCQIYDDDGGDPSFPDTLLGTSIQKASGGLAEAFAWEYFYLETPVEIDSSTTYWVVFNMASVSGTVEVQVSVVEASDQHAFFATPFDFGDGVEFGDGYHFYTDAGGVWTSQDNIQMKHKIRGSKQADRLAKDVIRFYKDPYQRIKITASGAPSLQLFDQVLVDIEQPMVVKGRYVIEGRRLIHTPELFTSIDKLRKVG